MCSGRKIILLISGKNLGPDAKVDVPHAYLPFALGTLQSVTFVSSEQGTGTKSQNNFCKT